MSSSRRVAWPLLIVAVLCLMPMSAGIAVIASGDDEWAGLGWAITGFFGAGVVVLGRKAFRP